MDQFDFVEIIATSRRKSDLKVARPTFSTTPERRLDGWQSYGGRSYPRYSYRVTVAYVDVVDENGRSNSAMLRARVNAAVDRAQQQFPNATIRTTYHARD
jgi:hypothetical protein